jgi:pSer/pThr/pTyr-binding forkhead associated (FHA) protein
VGRAATNFVQVDSEGVSRTHCQLRPTPEGLQLVDMTSFNGTLLNSKAVSQAVLKDHDVITLGDTNLIYRAEGDFGANAGFEMKNAGRPSQAETSVAGPQDMDKVVEAHLVFSESGENFSVAAEKLGMTEDELQELLGE